MERLEQAEKGITEVRREGGREGGKTAVARLIQAGREERRDGGRKRGGCQQSPP